MLQFLVTTSVVLLASLAGVDAGSCSGRSFKRARFDKWCLSSSVTCMDLSCKFCATWEAKLGWKVVVKLDSYNLTRQRTINYCTHLRSGYRQCEFNFYWRQRIFRCSLQCNMNLVCGVTMSNTTSIIFAWVRNTKKHIQKPQTCRKLSVLPGLVAICQQ